MSANLIKKIVGKAPVSVVKFFGNLWLPYLGAGIKITEVSKDYRHIKVCLKRTWWNANYVGTQFGGSIYAMTDPFFMLMLINNLGPEYIVWDKAAIVEFVKPGRTQLFAEFKIGQDLLDEIKIKTADNQKYVFDLSVEIKDKSDQLIARVNKTLYVRKKIVS